MVQQAKIAFLTWPTGLKSRVCHWLIMNRDLEGSFVFLWEFLQRYLSFRKCLRNIRKQAKKKKRREKELGRFGCVGARQSFAMRAATLPKNGLRWSQNSNCSYRKQCSTYKGRKNEWLAFFFRRKQSRMLGEKESKSDGELSRKHWFCIRGNI